MVESEVVDDCKGGKVVDGQDANLAGKCERRMRFQANFFDRFQNDCRQFNHQKGQDDRVSCINKGDPFSPLVFPTIFERIVVAVYWHYSMVSVF